MSRELRFWENSALEKEWHALYTFGARFEVVIFTWPLEFFFSPEIQICSWCSLLKILWWILYYKTQEGRANMNTTYEAFKHLLSSQTAPPFKRWHLRGKDVILSHLVWARLGWNSWQLCVFPSHCFSCFLIPSFLRIVPLWWPPMSDFTESTGSLRKVGFILQRLWKPGLVVLEDLQEFHS